jgi:hypothetical protein
VQQRQKIILTLTAREALYCGYSNNVDLEIFPLFRPLSHHTEAMGVDLPNIILIYFSLPPQQIIREYFMVNSGC